MQVYIIGFNGEGQNYLGFRVYNVHGHLLKSFGSGFTPTGKKTCWPRRATIAKNWYESCLRWCHSQGWEIKAVNCIGSEKLLWDSFEELV
jgi:hypothetical protein